MSPTANAPVFIVGHPRSGTTLVRQILTSHPRIFIPPPTRLLVSMRDAYEAFSGRRQEIETFVRDLLVDPLMERWNVDVRALIEFIGERKPVSYAGLVSAVYEFQGNRRGRVDFRWGEKSNFLLYHIDFLAGLYPQSQFIHIVRDGRDVACSMRDLGHLRSEQFEPFSQSVLEVAHYWNDRVKTIRISLRKLARDRVHELRYEDLVAAGETEVRALCRFLREDYGAELLEFHRQVDASELDEWERGVTEPLSGARSGRWRSTMFVEDADLFEAIAGETLDAYGYASDARESFKGARAAGWIYQVAHRLSRAKRRMVRRIRSRSRARSRAAQEGARA